MRENVNASGRRGCGQKSTKAGRKLREETMRTANLLFGLTLAALTFGPAPASFAQDTSDYPNRPIRVVVPVGAGAGMDNAARITAAAVEKHLGQRLIIENKPGAGTRIGSASVAKSAPDGYTLLFTSPSSIVVVEHFPQKMDYSPARDFRPVAIGMFQPVLLIVRPSLGVKSVDEFVAFAKKNPGKVSFGVQGLGGEMHLSLELFKKTAGVDITPVPYLAGAQAIVDLLADRLDAMFLVIPPIKQHVEAGRLLALATLNAKRVNVLPNVPTMTELGRPEMTNAVWFGYLAPAGTPDAIVDKLARAFAQIQSDTVMAERVSAMGAELNVIGPAEFGKIIDHDRQHYGKIVAEGNLATQN
jgi:tripartite-type tricarboxylate transporter receptor subunit TctC